MEVVLFMKDINWAVIGVGVIANEMANALIKDNRNIYSVANRTQKKHLILPINIILKRYMIILMMYLLIQMLMPYTLLHLIILIFILLKKQ